MKVIPLSGMMECCFSTACQQCRMQHEESWHSENLESPEGSPVRNMLTRFLTMLMFTGTLPL